MRERFHKKMIDLILQEAQSPFVFLLIFILLQPMGVPGFVFVSFAAQVWSPVSALSLSLFGGVLASLLGFFLARFVARDWLRKRIPARFGKIHRLFEMGSFKSVLHAHLLFYMAPPLSWGFGLSAIAVKEFLLGCFLGIIPGTLLILSVSRLAPSWIQGKPLMAVGLNIVLAIPCLLLINLLIKFRMKKDLDFTKKLNLPKEK